MKNYKEYERTYIGSSDYAALLVSGCKDGKLDSQYIHFGEDGIYNAYIVDGNAKIGNHYELECEFENWLKVYDDQGLVETFYAKHIKIYTAGDFGCIIQLIK